MLAAGGDRPFEPYERAAVIWPTDGNADAPPDAAQPEAEPAGVVGSRADSS